MGDSIFYCANCETNQFCHSERKCMRQAYGSPALTCCATRILKLTLKKKWFDLIASGEKKQEYRAIGNKWIESRILNREYDLIEFKNGYGPNVPTCLVEWKGYGETNMGRPEWGAVEGEMYWAIELGEVLEVKRRNTSPSDSPKG